MLIFQLCFAGDAATAGDFGSSYGRLPKSPQKEILGRDFLSQHQSVNFNFGGPKTFLELGALKPIKGEEPVKLFEHMSPNCEPVAVRTRYFKADQSFISD